jgi:O-antigen/teichoic acid export membrane protein
VGIYSAGYGVGNILLMVTIALALVLPPTLAKLYDEGRMDEVRVYLSYSLKYILALAIPFVFGATMLSQEVLRIFSTPAIASEGYFIVPLVALATLFLGINVVMGQSLFLVKKTKILGATWIVAGLTNLLLNILLIPHIGILGAAITTLITYALALGITTYYSVKEIRFSIEWSFILKSLVASAIMSLIIWMLGPVGTLAIIATVIVGVIIYGVILLSLKGFKGEDIKFFKGLFQRAA